MRALTLTQPWATLVAIGEKKVETRSWGTLYRDRIAIHAAKGFPADARAICHSEPFRSVLLSAGIRTEGDLPLGAIIAVAELGDCMRFTEHSEGWVRKQSDRSRYPRHEADFGDFSSGRYGFFLRLVQPLEAPIVARGMLSLWHVPIDIERDIEEQLEGVNRNTTATDPETTKGDPPERTAHVESMQ